MTIQYMEPVLSSLIVNSEGGQCFSRLCWSLPEHCYLSIYATFTLCLHLAGTTWVSSEMYPFLSVFLLYVKLGKGLVHSSSKGLMVKISLTVSV